MLFTYSAVPPVSEFASMRCTVPFVAPLVIVTRPVAFVYALLELTTSALPLEVKPLVVMVKPLPLVSEFAVIRMVVAPVAASSIWKLVPEWVPV